MQMDGRSGKHPAILLIGYGEVGQAFATQLAGSEAHLTVADPARAGTTVGGITIAAAPPPSMEDFDIVLAAVPSSASVAVAALAAQSPGSFVHADLSSSSRGLMREAAALFEGRPSRFADCAIMGAVSLQGARTPVIAAGTGATGAAAIMNGLGFRMTALPHSEAGDASALKLLRSVLTKGLEAITAECFVAARSMGLSSALRDQLQDIGETPFTDFLDMLVRTHVVHAPRRSHEVEAALGQLEEQQVPSTVTRSVLEAFRTTARRLEDAPAFRDRMPTADEALAWLAEDKR
jgi:3-hydroxyisobutyrate dehydrogenase-like beta-hydroxyacid dehydrogenase